jgi:hypothetical protein
LVPPVRPETVQESVPEVVQVRPPGELVTVYWDMVRLPLEDGADQETVAL